RRLRHRAGRLDQDALHQSADLPVVPPQIRLLGTSLDGSNVLFMLDRAVVSLDTNGTSRTYGTLPTSNTNTIEGWITSDFAAYIEQQYSSSDTELYYLKNGTLTFVNGNSNST